MYRGTRKFKCEHCGEVFTAPDIENNTTAASVPQRCPKCGYEAAKPYWAAGLIDTVINLLKPRK